MAGAQVPRVQCRAIQACSLATLLQEAQHCLRYAAAGECWTGVGDTRCGRASGLGVELCRGLHSVPQGWVLSHAGGVTAAEDSMGVAGCRVLQPNQRRGQGHAPECGPAGCCRALASYECVAARLTVCWGQALEHMISWLNEDGQAAHPPHSEPAEPAIAQVAIFDATNSTSAR